MYEQLKTILSFLLLIHLTSMLILGTVGLPQNHEKQNINQRGINREGLKKEYIATLISLAKTLPRKKVCMVVLENIKNKKHPLVKKIWHKGKLGRKKFVCDKFRRTKSKKLSSVRQSTIDIMIKLYNQLPLPFQCYVLASTTMQYLDHRGLNHISVRGTPSQSNRVEDGETRPSLFERKQTVTKGIEEAERLLSVYKILPVAHQCKRLINKKNAFSKSIYITVMRTASVSDISKVSQKIRETVPGIVEHYVREKGIKIGLSLIDRHWLRNLQSVLFISMKEQNHTATKFIFKCKIFLALDNTGPINANLVIAALHDYGKDILSKQTGLKIDFNIVLDDGHVTPNMKDQPQFQQEFFNKQVFPKYLGKYFKSLDSTEKENLLELVSIYSNQTKSNVLDMLLNERGLMLAKFIQTRTRRIKSHEAIKAEKIKSKQIKSNRKTSFITQLTNIEIIMITALAFLFVFGVAFIFTFVIFKRRKREFQRRVNEINKKKHKDTFVVLQGSSTSCNSSKSSSSDTKCSQTKKGVHKFCTRTNHYSEQSSVQSEDSRTTKTDSFHL